jgi:Mn-dependent DtxR family transcriptional regulator
MIKRNGLTYSVRRYGRMNSKFTQIPNDVFLLVRNANSFKVYCYLCYRYNRDYQYAFPSLNTISKECGISVPTVSKSIKELENLKLIAIERFTDKTSKYSNNMYYVFYPVLDYDTHIEEKERELNEELRREQTELMLEKIELELNEEEEKEEEKE